jgi:hypothetical protein
LADGLHNRGSWAVPLFQLYSEICLLLWTAREISVRAFESQVKVPAQLTVSQSVRLGIEAFRGNH